MRERREMVFELAGGYLMGCGGTVACYLDPFLKYVVEPGNPIRPPGFLSVGYSAASLRAAGRRVDTSVPSL